LKDVEPIHFVKSTYIYAAPETKQGPREKHVDLYLPRHVPGPWPLVTWLHAGGFRSGTRRNRKHGLAADAFARHGYACAFIDYRLARPPAVLSRPSRQLVRLLIADAEACGDEMQESFRRQRPIAVIEDVATFYQWLAPRMAEFNLDGSHILAGSSAGGISVLNSLALSPNLQLELPEIRTAFVFSGGFAYPSYWRDTDTRILAFHNLADAHVPYSSIQRLEGIAKRNFTLVTSDRHAHGSFATDQEEDYLVSIARLIAFDRSGQWS